MTTSDKAAKDLARIRRRALMRYIRLYAGGNLNEFAKSIKRSHAYVWQMTHGKRAIGERTARWIEHQLQLVPGSMDKIPGQQREEQRDVLHVVVYNPNPDIKARKIRAVPLVSDKDVIMKKRSTGRGQLVIDFDAIDARWGPQDRIFAPDEYGPKTLGLKVEDDSMEPLLNIEDVVFYDLEITRPEHDHAVVLVSHPRWQGRRHLLFRRERYNGHESIYLRAANSYWLDRRPREIFDPKQHVILGTMLSVHRKPDAKSAWLAIEWFDKMQQARLQQREPNNESKP